MSVIGPRAPSRSATLLLVAAAHGIVLWLIWRVRVPVEKQPDTFASVMFFLPQAKSQAAITAPRAVRANRASHSMPAPQPLPAQSATAITLAATPAARIDWSAQLAGTARAEVDREAKARKQLLAVTRSYALEIDPRDSGRAPASTFRWYEAGIHHIDTRGNLPVLVLNDHCALLMFIIPLCRIGHVEIHGDLFEGAAAAHDEDLSPAVRRVPP
jgi:hypothetical protein